MQEITPDTIHGWGIVGAGGAGFPASVKMKARAEYFLLNAAECEPLLHKDKELLLHYAEEILEGMTQAARLTGASKIVVGIKEKYHAVIERLEAVRPPAITIQPLVDSYPAGDEFLLVYDITGRVIPPGGLPIHVGAVVNNVETMLNLARRRPVTHKYLTVCGAARRPVTLCAPLGISIRRVIEAAGGAAIEDFDILLNGAMMGRPCDDLDEPVTKTTGGVYILPRDHILMRRHRKPLPEINRIGRSACDQCSFCTEMCPRYLLGHPIEPHRDMRALGFVLDPQPHMIGSQFCCECNICTMIACPEDLDPRKVCIQHKQIVRRDGLKWDPAGREIRPHPMYDFRRTPLKRLIHKLGLQGFVNEGPLREEPLAADFVRLPLRQHVGAACAPVVKVGQKVKAGEVVAAPPEGQLGAPVHASVTGRVTAIEPMIEIRA